VVEADVDVKEVVTEWELGEWKREVVVVGKVSAL